MNKNALIGMVMLVGLVASKAIISMDEAPVADAFSRADESISNFQESAALRSELNSNNSISSSANLLASAFTTPSFDGLSAPIQFNDVADVSLGGSSSEINLNSEETSGDIRPMESYSNTGYGMWIGSSEEEDIDEESAPLDGGNTITDNISRLFPISH
ncbi:MAG: hypothetical protein ACI857_001579 [Arenicella sp.]|jgi:hypothetical protein